MASLVALDGAIGEGGGQVLRTALSLSLATGRPFEMRNIRARRPRPGLMPQHLAAVRGAAIACAAKVQGAVDGSQDLRFEPGSLNAGEFRFEIGTAGSCSLVLQTLVPALALAGAPSAITVTGGTHVPQSPPFDYLAHHWAAALALAGLAARFEMVEAGFYPRGGGEVRATVEPWSARRALALVSRGPMRAVRGVSGAARLKNRVAERQRDAAASRIWEDKRLAAEWTLAEPKAPSPGSYVQLQGVFEGGLGAFGALGERGVRAEQLGDRVARAFLRFLDGDAAVDRHLADQLAVVMAISGEGGRVSTSEITAHLETVTHVLRSFGFEATVSGRRGGPGMLEVAATAYAAAGAGGSGVVSR